MTLSLPLAHSRCPEMEILRLFFCFRDYANLGLYMTLVLPCFLNHLIRSEEAHKSTTQKKYVTRITIPLYLTACNVHQWCKNGRMKISKEIAVAYFVYNYRQTASQRAELKLKFHTELKECFFSHLYTELSQLTDNNFFVFGGCFAFWLFSYATKSKWNEKNLNFYFTSHAHSILVEWDCCCYCCCSCHIETSSKFEMWIHLA